MEAEYWVCGRGHKGLIESGTPPWEMSCEECALVEMTQERDAVRASLLAYGTHKPGCGGLTSTTGRACECGWIQVRDLAKAQEVIDG